MPSVIGLLKSKNAICGNVIFHTQYSNKMFQIMELSVCCLFTSEEMMYQSCYKFYVRYVPRMFPVSGRKPCCSPFMPRKLNFIAECGLFD